jgi:hypothetical protein
MSGRAMPIEGLLPRKGEATPPPEPTRARRQPAGRRVSATLPLDLYVAFKTHVAKAGIPGDQVIIAAIRKAIAES